MSGFGIGQRRARKRDTLFSARLSRLHKGARLVSGRGRHAPHDANPPLRVRKQRLGRAQQKRKAGGRCGRRRGLLGRQRQRRVVIRGRAGLGGICARRRAALVVGRACVRRRLNAIARRLRPCRRLLIRRDREVLGNLRADQLAEHAMPNAKARSVGRVKDAETRVAEELDANRRARHQSKMIPKQKLARARSGREFKCMKHLNVAPCCLAALR
jgi:hypothetical protein